MKKILLALATIAAAMTLLAGPAGAQYDDGPSATIDDTTVRAGQAVNVSGECPDADSVSLEIEDGPFLGTIAVNDDGTFSGSVTIPENAPPGDYTLLLTCGDEVLGIGITVLGEGGGRPGRDRPGGGGVMTGGGTGSGPALARTGTEVDGLVKIGGGLLVAGAAAVLFATKRRSATA